VEAESDLALDEIASFLIDDLYRVVENHDLQLDASLNDEAGKRHWN
jgi:hypothetical protein